MESTELEKVRTRISKLLAQAERTDHPEEATTFYAAAEEQMLRYNLHVEQTSSRFHRAKIVCVRFKFSGPALYWRPWAIGAEFIVSAVDRVVLVMNERNREFILYGTAEDTEYVERLLKSAWRSAFNSMKRETRENTGYLMTKTNADKSKFRKSYIEGFGDGVASKIDNAHALFPGAGMVLAHRKQDIAQAMSADGVTLQSKTYRRTVNTLAYNEGFSAGSNSPIAGRAAV